MTLDPDACLSAFVVVLVPVGLALLLLTILDNPGDNLDE